MAENSTTNVSSAGVSADFVNVSVWEQGAVAVNGSWTSSDSTTLDSLVACAGSGVKLSQAMLIVGNIYLCVNILLSSLTNITLIIVILLSPNLKTPPNSHLINICVNNLLLAVCMVLSVLSMNLHVTTEYVHTVLSGFQLFLVTNSFLQYWNTFTAIGYYRYRTVKKPCLSLKIRREIIRKSITANWLVSILLSLVFTLSFVDDTARAENTLSPFQYEFPDTPTPEKLSSVEGITMAYAILLTFLVDLIIIVTCYYRIFMALDLTGTFGKSRVSPWHRPSIIPDSTDLVTTGQRIYTPTENNWIKPFTISENFIVHYQKRDNSLNFEDVFALENPIVAAATQKRREKRKLEPTLSTISSSSTRSKCPEFSDISAGAELQRFQKMKNNSALKKQSLRRDRVSLSSATKNSLVMLCTFLSCSMPLFLCSAPAILAHLFRADRITALIVCRLLFYLNAPAYPTWYLLFSKRVKKCLTRVTENALARFRGTTRRNPPL